MDHEPTNSGRSAEIAAALEAEINDGRLLAGEMLDERLLALRFGVSRTPIREALQQLSARGLVRILPRQGVFVARMSVRELRAMFELLAELEGACAKLAARRLDESLRARLLDACERGANAAERGDVGAYSQANVDFHDALYDGCRNDYVADMVRSIRRRTQIYRNNAFQQPGRMRQSSADHQRVVDAVLAGDGVAAQREMVEHISVGGTGFAEFVSMLPPEMLNSHAAAYPPSRARKSRPTDVPEVK